MVRVDRADLAKALSEGFPQATAEKVWRLLGVLREFQARPTTHNRFTLKGGTALNVFHWPQAPRLSVDLDLMATGFPDAAPGTASRETALRSVREVLQALGYSTAETEGDAGRSLLGSYTNSLGSQDRLKVDLDLLNRMTLLEPVESVGPVLFDADDLRFLVVDPAELMGQKLTAVAYRAVERDLFDMHLLLLSDWPRTHPQARAMYLAYSFLQDHEWGRLDYPVRLEVDYKPERLVDVLRGKDTAPSLEQVREQALLHLQNIETPFTSALRAEQELAFPSPRGRSGGVRGPRGGDERRPAKGARQAPGAPVAAEAGRESAEEAEAREAGLTSDLALLRSC